MDKKLKFRPIDKKAAESVSWWGKSFVFIKKGEIKSWLAIFMVAFIAGMAAALIFTIPMDLTTSTYAGYVPINSCTANPAGGDFIVPTVVTIQCGSSVRKASYQWNDGAAVKFIDPDNPSSDQNPKRILYDGIGNQDLKFTGKYISWYGVWKSFEVSYPFKSSFKCYDSDSGADLTKKGLAFGINSVTGNKEEVKDSCVNEGVVKKWSCASSTNQIISANYTCPAGTTCNDGICRNIPASCGIDKTIFKIGSTTSFAISNPDSKFATRTNVIYVPSNYKNKEMPLIVNLHGLGGNAKQQADDLQRLETLANQEGFIVVYPSASKYIGIPTWNILEGILSPNVDDVGYIKELVEDVSKKICIDKKRVYVTGVSNGGAMTNRLACEASDIFAAASPVASYITDGISNVCASTLKHPMPILFYHGTGDSVVKYERGEKAFNMWASSTLNNCKKETSYPTLYKDTRTDDTSETKNTLDSYCITYTCANNTQTTMCTLDTMDHCWPGVKCPVGLGPLNDEIVFDKNASNTSTNITSINALKHQWDFLKNYTLP